MLWLSYVFYSVMFAIGAAGFVLFLRAKEVRAWIWLVVALVGAAGLVLLVAADAGRFERKIAMGATFALFALDASVQYVQSRRLGAPKGMHLVLTLGWLTMSIVQFAELPERTPS